MTRAPLIFLALTVVGTLAPLAAFLPWLGRHGLDVELFFQNLFANRVSAFFAMDVIVSALVVVAALFLFGQGFSALQRAAVLLATFIVGVSAGLPLFFFFRHRVGAPMGEGA